jgi:hypothetical protein
MWFGQARPIVFLIGVVLTIAFTAVTGVRNWGGIAALGLALAIAVAAVVYERQRR